MALLISCCSIDLIQLVLPNYFVQYLIVRQFDNPRQYLVHMMVNEVLVRMSTCVRVCVRVCTCVCVRVCRSLGCVVATKFGKSKLFQLLC